MDVTLLANDTVLTFFVTMGVGSGSGADVLARLLLFVGGAWSRVGGTLLLLPLGLRFVGVVGACLVVLSPTRVSPNSTLSRGILGNPHSLFELRSLSGLAISMATAWAICHSTVMEHTHCTVL